jgi:hypothetical protein
MAAALIGPRKGGIMAPKRSTLVPYVAVLVLVGLATAPWPSSAPAALASTPTVIEGFEAPDTVTVSTDNLDFRGDRPYVGLEDVSYVPGKLGNAMRVDFSIIGGFWQNVMVKLNQGVPWNLTGQTQLDITMKGDWNDTGGDQSVSFMMKMTNGSFWGQSFAVTKRWQTYTFPLDPSGAGWYSSGPDWGWKDDFTIDQIAYITFFVSPPQTGHYSLWFDDVAVERGTLLPYVDPDAPTPLEFSSIPYAVGQAVDDMGWRDWDNRRESVMDYQQLLAEKATLTDYQTVVDIGEAAGTRLMTVWILQDLDRHNVVASPRYNTPVAQYDMTIDGLDFRNHVTPKQVQIMHLVKRSAAFMEFGMHGVSHEHFRNGVEQRAEYAHINESKPGHARTWGWKDMNLKARCFREILRQWFTRQQLPFPIAEVPPAHAYYYSETDPHTTGALLAKYGVKYVNGGMNVSTRIYDGYLIDHGVIFINRAYGTNWDWVGSTPWEGYWNDYDAPYYPSDNYAWNEAHFPNLWDAKTKWVNYLVGLNDSNNRFLARNSAEASWQFLYHKFGTITRSDDTYTIDVSAVDPQAYAYDLIGPMVLKVYVGDQDVSNISLTNGASVFAYWRDTFGYAYVVIGENGNPMGRLDPTTYQMTVSFGDETMPSYVDLTGATYDVEGFDVASDVATLALDMYGTQTVRVKLPFEPSTVTSSDPSLIVRDWSYANGFLQMRVKGVNLIGERGTITMTR